MSKKHPTTMTDAQFKQAIFDLRDQWAKDSNNGTQTQNDLDGVCELFIGHLDVVITNAGGHPDPPAPRIRP